MNNILASINICNVLIISLAESARTFSNINRYLNED